MYDMPAAYIFRSHPAEQGKFYFDDKTVPSVILSFRGITSDGEKWVGQLYFKCLDVPRLMREDIRWTAENIIREDGFFSTIHEAQIKEPSFKLDDLIKDGFTTTRHFFMCHLPANTTTRPLFLCDLPESHPR
ncbi:hypothetical protein F5Y02DRAFT_370516 [Annulohypoxylon stygium]|nr:hypothetical protein F5Y02DRAFT_370516 [Annulohypoxylon stygium]